MQIAYDSQMKDYEPIACQSYDYLEIACMDRYEIRVFGESSDVQGIAAGMETKSGEEFLLLELGDSSTDRIRIDRIKAIEVLTRPARFTHYELQGA